jgi:hypothetical protein
MATGHEPWCEAASRGDPVDPGPPGRTKKIGVPGGLCQGEWGWRELPNSNALTVFGLQSTNVIFCERFDHNALKLLLLGERVHKNKSHILL